MQTLELTPEQTEALLRILDDHVCGLLCTFPQPSWPDALARVETTRQGIINSPAMAIIAKLTSNAIPAYHKTINEHAQAATARIKAS